MTSGNGNSAPLAPGASDAQLALLARSTSHWLALMDPQRRIIWCNEAFYRGTGRGPEDMLGRLIRESFSTDLNDKAELLRIAKLLDAGLGARSELLIRGANGQGAWLDVDFQPVLDTNKTLVGFAAAAVEISEQRDQRELLAVAVNGAGLGTWNWHVRSDELVCNDRLLAILGYERGDVIMTGAGTLQLIHPDDGPRWIASLKAHLSNPLVSHRMELRLKSADGQWRWMLFTGALVSRKADLQTGRVAGVAIDINAQKLLEDQLRVAARVDTLTQLPNRKVVLDCINHALVRGREEPGFHFAVLFMDFDRFKQVNDTLGHSVGDELLRQIARRLKDCLRPGDTFVRSSDFGQTAARIGGDEFVVVLDDIRGDLDAQVVAQRLLEVLAEPYQIGEHKVSSTVSIGIVTTQHAADDADSVLRDADIAMYEAKRGGRGRYEMFDPSMRKRVRDDVAIENDLRQALVRNEFFVVYQPLLDLATGVLAGMEALVRWRHPQRGVISPVEFIPVAEACGLIGSLGLVVLEAACRELAHMQKLLGPLAPPKVAVNVSRAQLRHEGLAAQVLDVLRDTGILAEQLQIEVTESLAAQDDVVKRALHAIKALGVTLSLDDFGTGYSSLSCLHELPVDVVKIDRSFVMQAQNSAYHRVLIEATIRMSQTLGLGTVAEGIETVDQAALMLELGCDKGQGYLYSKPLEASAFVAWVRERASLQVTAHDR